jgi:hypothetical protein
MDHPLDAAYARAVFDAAGVPAIGAVLENMVRRGERDDVRDALSFTEDVIRFGMHLEFASYFCRSSLLEAVRDHVCGPDYFSRHLAVYTLTRAGPRGNAGILAQAFPWYLAHDPFGLDGLLSQLSVFGRRLPTLGLRADDGNATAVSHAPGGGGDSVPPRSRSHFWPGPWRAQAIHEATLAPPGPRSSSSCTCRSAVALGHDAVGPGQVGAALGPIAIRRTSAAGARRSLPPSSMSQTIFGSAASLITTWR